MIARSWRALARTDDVSRYAAYFGSVVLHRLEALPGFLGAYLLQRDTQGGVEVIVQTLWESRDAIQRFAGPEIATAVVDPEAESMLVSFDEVAVHHEVLISPSA